MRDDACRLKVLLLTFVFTCFNFLFLSACGDSGSDCYQSGECECTQKEHCPEDKDCVNGVCSRLVPPPPPKKEFGQACFDSEECLSGFCLPVGPGNGGVCTRECSLEACPDEWECKTHLPQDGSGAVGLCVQLVENRLCHACSVATQCNAIGDLCIEIAGQFVCALDCSLNACPTGYGCVETEVAGGVASQCIPQGGSCECSDLTIGLTRSCTVSNQHGTCYGLETCQAADPVPNWGACAAEDPRQEICNGSDDDCDGLTDAEDPSVDVSMLATDPPYPSCRKGSILGDCTGLWNCVLGEEDTYVWECGANDPENEICNGRDDNCDGIIDDPFVDQSGRYVDVAHCGGCGGDCEVLVPNLQRGPNGEIVPNAVTCLIRNSMPLCVPALCEPGFYPYPEQAPVTCAELISSACQACGHNADCRISSDLCVNVGEDPGTFCAQSCDPASAYFGCTGQVGTQSCCPDQYICEMQFGGLFCLPQAGTCTCNAEKVGATRSCLLSGAGSQMCQGEQICSEIGPDVFAWQECEPSSIVVEVCDALDNNCDGQVDEGFIDQDGIYYTDQHCGVCNHNCLAQWDQQIQHAIGGCVVLDDNGRDCQIVACTTERADGWGPCRRDEDCQIGTYCDPLYHHCVNPNPDECPGGICKIPCQNDAECIQRWGSGYICDLATSNCLIEFLFVDTNTEETDGCECPVAIEDDSDQPDLADSFPQPGEYYVDRNCDGIDGEIDQALFVWSGTDQSLGTRQHPYGTINQALVAFDSSHHTIILVAAGYYQENLVLAQGVQLYGGYAPDFSRRDIVLYPSIIRGNQPDYDDPNYRPGTIYVNGIQTARTVLAGFMIHGYDVNAEPVPGQAAKSSYAIYVRNSNSNLVIMNNTVIGGRGGDGAAGLPSASGNNGGDGGLGQDSWECPGSQDCAGLQRSGGAAGNNPSCNQASGNPGATAREFSGGLQDYLGGGINGSGGSDSSYGHSDPEQYDYCKYDCQVGGAGSSCNGGDAQAGNEGQTGSGGRGCFVSGGVVSNGLFEAQAGSSGSSGTHGSGGGGGGAGGAVINYNEYSGCTQGNPYGDLGASGGGGGAGGCRGIGGLSGAGGGGSFGVFLYFSTASQNVPVIRANRIRRGFGGLGGSGGGAGQGGLGGQAGSGGETVLPAWCAGSGGRGGRGGDGGAGGGGGGGCGGVSYGIATNYVDDQANPSIMDNLFEAPGTSQTGGAGGAGGPSPAGASYAGSQGTGGLSSDTWIY
ncbi:MAG: hypothetical protein JRJ87_02895 [Deltaproteobacteria bacterium]|nr:hypothetical protein [Deltaproteobacteria bacterium]